MGVEGSLLSPAVYISEGNAIAAALQSGGAYSQEAPLSVPLLEPRDLGHLLCIGLRASGGGGGHCVPRASLSRQSTPKLESWTDAGA